ncbi:hypothetical protein S101258_00264 [Lactiplantibacillus plantarum subsp. plantarum]|uniref:LysR substrate-binding domain-containing protein n=1 Tax=Lactiplantibacillus plantarum subsp. plantarum TaxID=337330 RepID=A0A2S3U9I4_LACPN|nr:hypothetical protein S101258_00264 [Lactiplantibacillus plantarum subsp. plantarum]
MFYNTTCSTLNILDEGKTELAQKIKRDAGIINIACIPTSIGTRLPKLIKDFQEKNTKSPYFILHDAFSLPILDGLTNGKYDIGICSRDLHYQELSFIPLFLKKSMVIVPPHSSTWPCEEEINTLDATTLQLNYVFREDTNWASVRHELNAKCPNLTFAESYDGEIAIAGQVVENNDVGIVADTVLVNSFNVVKVPLAVPSDTRTVYIAYNHTRQIAPTLQAFIDYIQSTMHNITLRFR